ncbi:MAG: tRNA 2-thiouridine(34) synthase MnmA [Planctomycetota bacterium]
MSRKGKVIVAMSGGVDSSVAACLLKGQGYDCVGVFMRVGTPGADTPPQPDECTTDATSPPPRRLKHGCCSAADAADARAISARLGIPFYALNFEQEFSEIVTYFVDEYARARTPNPCIMCNTRLKFGKLLRYADMLDAEFVATGHYARLVECPEGPRLGRARHRAKDQSYVLFGIERSALPRCRFPLGEIADKTEVRRIAASLDLRVHDKPESQEICFVPDNDYKRLVRQQRPETERPGEVRDTQGRLLGTHRGIVNYTIGQRRGLGIAAGSPIYVTNLDARTNTVTVGSHTDLLCPTLIADQINWLIDPPATNEPQRCHIKIRHTHSPAPGALTVLPDGTLTATFDEPQPSVTPGQAVVCYDQDDLVICGGWIQTTRSRED